MRAAFLVAAAVILRAQSAPPPTFDVASVRLTQHGRTPDGYSHSSLNDSHGRLDATNVSLEGLIEWAYHVKQYQIDGPEWLNSDSASYDIAAKTEPATPVSQLRQMLQTLLAERFKLQLHRETRKLTGYELLVAKNGPKALTPSAAGGSSINSQNGKVTVQHTGMASFAEQLARWVRTPVFDKTGLAGAFDFNLDYAPDENRDGETRPSVYAALEQQLGLKLQGAKVPVEVLVIDRVERIPTEN